MRGSDNPNTTNPVRGCTSVSLTIYLMEILKSKNNKMQKHINKDVIEIGEIEIDVRSEKTLYVRIGDWIVYIDDSTNERIITTWER